MRRNGFTLIEMLASTGIGSVVLLVGVLALSNTGDEYGRSTDGVAAEREARAILTLVAEDMSKAAGRRLEFEEADDGWRRDQLGFTCLQPKDAQAENEAIGDLCLVSYYVKDLEIGRETVRCLMRGFRGSEEVFAALKTDQLDPLFDERNVDEPVAFGVISFEVEPLVRQQGGGFEAWDEPAEGEIEAEMPDVVRLKLVVARRELAAKLREGDDWDNSPLIGEPQDAERNDLLEVYEIIHPFGHAN
ncbi:MAG: prepilin-type N-terminal cleavage/methylation domain-containing protein [Verrucomicrobiota bacterium]